MQHWTRENIAWLAGLVEGEGSIVRYWGGGTGPANRGLRGGRISWNLSIQMTDLDVVERAHEIAGCGTVGGPYQNKGDGKKKYKETWIWHVTRRAEVYAILVAIWPWFCKRRQEKATEALLDLPPIGRQPLKVCKRGHDRTTPGALQRSGNCRLCARGRIR